MESDGVAEDDEEALGGGDVYLAGVLGLMLGSRFIMNGLAVGILFGGLVSLVFVLALLVQRRYSSNSLMTFIPYGPYLIAGAAYMLFFG
jgi:prepilin signal peptidase PulO-like enzyme (type II secretory pathway)